MSGYGDRDNSEQYVEGNRGDANYIDSNPTRGEHAGKGGTMDKIKDAMGMGSKNRNDSSDYDSSNTGGYGSGNTRDNYDSTNTSSYGSGQTGRDTTDTYGSSGRDTSDTYGSSGRDTYGSDNTTSQFGVGNNTSSFTDQSIGSTKGGDAFANKAYDGQRSVDEFTTGTGVGASNLTSRTGDDNYGQGDTYGSGRDTSDTYGSTGRGQSDTYGSSGRDDTYGSRGGDDYDGSNRHEKKEGMMDKVKDKMGMRTNADAYDQDRNTRNVDSDNY